MNIQKLNNFTRAPDYIAYLAYILTAMTDQEERIRTIAGYLLKNNARLIHNVSPEVAMYVKAAVLQAFTDTSIMIRNAAGHDIVAFLGTLEPRNWPECLQQLVTMLDSPELDRQEVSVIYLHAFFIWNWRTLLGADRPLHFPHLKIGVVEAGFSVQLFAAI